MIDKFLLPSQTDKLYQSFSVYGVNPKEFDIKHSKSSFKVTHGTTGFYCEINDIRETEPRFDDPSYKMEFIPRDTNIKTKLTLKHFSDVRKQFEIWLRHLAREIKQPDYWSILQEEAKSLPLFSETDAPNTSFSSTELDFIKQQLDETKNFIFANFELSQEHQTFVETKLKYLEECAKKSEHGRLDWFNIAIGVLMSIIVGISFNPEQAKTLINFVGKALSPLFGGSIPLLP